MKKRIAAIIQARMNSSRLPQKVLKDLQGKPLLYRLKEQLIWSKSLDEIIIATSTDQKDAPIYLFCQENNISCFRGDLDNVLKRYIDCAIEFNVDIILRITADNPLMDPESIDNMVKIFYEIPDIDYINNAHKKGLVHGAGCELVTRGALEKSLKMIEKYDNNKRWNYYEHVTIFIRKHPTYFNTIKYEAPIELSRNDLFFSVDYPEDLEVVNIIFKNLYKEGKYIQPKEIVNFLDEHPKIVKINSHLHDSLPEW
jgi:spore coat polysaccharide biosynthesis protein SpsF